MSLFLPSSPDMQSTRSPAVAAGRPELALGTFVKVDGRAGRVRYLGKTKFADGYWVGVELVDAFGKNNGTVQGIQYFSCAPGHGVFARPQRVSIIGKREYLYVAKGSDKPEAFASMALSMIADVVAVPPSQLDHVPFLPEGLIAHDSLGPGAEVLWRSVPCTVVHIGRTLFAQGHWIGLDLHGASIPPAPPRAPSQASAPYFRWQGASLTLVFVKVTCSEIEVVAARPSSLEDGVRVELLTDGPESVGHHQLEAATPARAAPAASQTPSPARASLARAAPARAAPAAAAPPPVPEAEPDAAADAEYEDLDLEEGAYDFGSDGGSVDYLKQTDEERAYLDGMRVDEIDDLDGSCDDLGGSLEI